MKPYITVEGEWLTVRVRRIPLPGTRIEVWDPWKRKWYPATVTRFDPYTSRDGLGRGLLYYQRDDLDFEAAWGYPGEGTVRIKHSPQQADLFVKRKESKSS